MSDLISRQAAITHFKKRLMETAINNVGVKENADRVYSEMADYRVDIWMNEIPSAQPERKTGKWLAVEYDNNAQPHIMLAKPIHEEADDISDNPFVHCSVCGKSALLNGWSEKYVLSNFCPNCGARMIREGEKMTNEEAINLLDNLIGMVEDNQNSDYDKTLHMAINSLKAEPHWIPCSERLPKRIINGDVETEQEFFVTIKERWPGEEWKYHTDIAWIPGDYIDDVWQTYNDWKEGQEVHVIAWMPLPEPYNPDDFSQHMNPPESE